ncbi:MAG: archease [Planctomycetes bacterium]|nr:archease [Planctomycetota bacterium]
MAEPSYRFFDHTGDFGVDVEAPDEGAAVAACARAFLALLTDAPETVAEREAREVSVTGIDAPATLVALGNELLYLFEVERFLCARFSPARVEATRIEGTAHGERFDPARHPIARPVKAVTHHQAALARRGRVVRARLIFDL